MDILYLSPDLCCAPAQPEVCRKSTGVRYAAIRAHGSRTAHLPGLQLRDTASTPRFAGRDRTNRLAGLANSG